MRMQSMAVALATLSLAWIPLQVGAHDGEIHEESELTPAARRDLAALRAATARYHDFDLATTGGGWTVTVPFPPAEPECMVDTEGAYDGGMGYHFLNPLNVGSTDPSRPAALIYEPEKDGTMRLVGIEFISGGLEGDTPPVLFGQSFEWNSRFAVWTLHVWTWRYNPNGLFAAWNPMVSCEHAFL